MKSLFHSITICVTIAGVLGASSSIHAGGSVAYQEVADLLPEKVRTHLEQAFVIPEVGSATRLGRQFVNLGGKRLTPYLFEVSSRVVPDTKWELLIHMDVEFQDAQGRPVSEPEQAEKVEETFSSYEVRPLVSETVQEEPTVPTSKANDEIVIDWAQDIYSEVNGLTMNRTQMDFEAEAGLEGTLWIDRDADGVIRRMKMDAAAGDHGAVEFEAYYAYSQQPAFVLWTDSYWRFNPSNPNSTVDAVTERRLYFSPEGKLLRFLEKDYQGSGELQIIQNRDKAVNREISADSVGAFEFHKNLSNLVLVSPAADVAREIEDLLYAFHMLTPKGN